MKIKINIDSGFFCRVALFLLIFPLRWVIGFLVAITIHECSHLLTIKMMGIQVGGISVSGNGIKMKTGEMSPIQELAGAFAGPFGGALLLLFWRIFPEAAVCAIVHSVFNLLPIYPFDGGRIITSLCRSIFGDEKGNKIGNRVGLCALVFLTFISINAIKYLGVVAFLPIIFLVVSTKNIPLFSFKISHALDK